MPGTKSISKSRTSLNAGTTFLCKAHGKTCLAVIITEKKQQSLLITLGTFLVVVIIKDWQAFTKVAHG